MNPRGFLILLFAGACSHQPAVRETSPEALEASSTIAAAPEVPKADPAVLHRADVVRMLDKTPGYFLQKVAYEPAVREGRFVGWRMDAPLGPLSAGDIVQSVNGRAIERPEQLYDVWQALKTSNELVVTTLHGLQSRTLRWQIVDDGSAGGGLR